jgi:anaerobic magnesium-protoporphyrin IX monomethyl ester cyclase
VHGAGAARRRLQYAVQVIGAGLPTVALLSLHDVENNAVRQLASASRAAGFRVLELYWQDWRNNRFEAGTAADEEALVDLLRKEGVSLVGMSVRASAYEAAGRHLTQRIRRSLGLPVLIGGWHATVRPERCILFGDAVCIGEADESLPAFLRAFSPGSELPVVPGFWVRDFAGRIRKAPPSVPVVDLDRLSLRDYEHADKFVFRGGRVTRGDPMATDPLFQIMCSLGCVQRCGFCHNSFEVAGTEGVPRIRFRSVRSVIDEIIGARKRNPRIRRVRFDDEIFGLNLAWLEEFSRVYPVEVGLPMDILSEPSVVTDRYADLLAQAGDCTVHLGLQFTEEVNREVLGRRAARETTSAAIERLGGRGMHLRYLVMVDIPGVTDAQKAELFHFLRGVPRPWDLYLFSLTHFPGSAYVEERLRNETLTEDEVEGQATKTFTQYRVDLSSPRPSEDVFWLSMLVLLSSQVVPPAMLDRFLEMPSLKAHPEPLRILASSANLLKMARAGGRMLKDGELTATLLHRWWWPGRMITT